MFPKFKNKISIIAKQAVIMTEIEFGSYKNHLKKNKSIQFVINHLPVPQFFKKIVGILFANYIENCVEIAFAVMKNKIVELRHVRRKDD